MEEPPVRWTREGVNLSHSIDVHDCARTSHRWTDVAAEGDFPVYIAIPCRVEVAGSPGDGKSSSLRPICPFDLLPLSPFCPLAADRNQHGKYGERTLYQEAEAAVSLSLCPWQAHRQSAGSTGWIRRVSTSAAWLCWHCEKKERKTPVAWLMGSDMCVCPARYSW